MRWVKRVGGRTVILFGAPEARGQLLLAVAPVPDIVVEGQEVIRDLTGEDRSGEHKGREEGGRQHGGRRSGVSAEGRKSRMLNRACSTFNR